VAAFCTKCGAALAPGAQFCTSCGAPAGAAAAPVAPTQPYIYAQPPAPAPAASGASAVKVILIVVGVIVGLGLLSVIVFTFSVWRLSRHVHVSGGGDAVTVSTPNGTISTNSTSTVSEADLGVPIYPGAARQEGGISINGPTGSMVTVVFSTPDPISKVVDFYKAKVGTNSSVITSDTGAVISTATQNNKESVVITIGKDTSSSGGATKIAIMRSKNQ
jgi:zinc-ribbon domain